MSDPIKDTIKTLNDLIETCKDGEEGFKACAEDIKVAELKSLFIKRASGCADSAAELQRLVRGLGGDPETSTSVSADVHRRWVDLKSLITGKDEEAVLNEAERGEDVAKKSYSNALAKDYLPADIRAVIEEQYQGVLRNHDQVKALRDQARAQP